MGTIAARMLLGMLTAAATTGATAQAPFEHREFDATLDAPYRAAPAQGRSQGRAFTLHFSYPAALREQAVTWRLELLASSGRPVQQWFGVARLFERAVTLRIPWGAGKDAAALPDGNYQLRLRALAQERRAGMAAPLAPRARWPRDKPA